MPISSASKRQSIANARLWKLLKDWALNNGRVTINLIADSNGMHYATGWDLGIHNALATCGVPFFGTGLIGAGYPRFKYIAGGQHAWAPFTSESSITGSAATKTRHGLFYTTAGVLTYTEATKRITGTGQFTNYVWKSGDRWYGSGGTGLSATLWQNPYIITQKVSNDTIELSTGFGADATNITGYLCPAAGASGNSLIPDAFARRFNVPAVWLPFGNAAVYQANSGSESAGTTFGFGQGLTLQNGFLPLNGPLTASVVCALGTNSSTINMRISSQSLDAALGGAVTDHATGTPSLSGASDGELGSFRLNLAGDSDRVASTNRDWLNFGVGGSGSTGRKLILFSHLENASLARGFSYNPLLCRGGDSAYDQADIAKFMDDQTWDSICYGINDQHAVATGGTGTRRHLIIINTGFNDAAENGLSWDGVNTSNTAAGQKANLLELMTRIRTRWNAYFGANADQTELFFMLMPSHPVSDAPTTPGTATNPEVEARLRILRQAQRELAMSTHNTFFIDIQQLLGSDAHTFLNDSRFLTVRNNDMYHMSSAGYRAVAGIVFDALNTVAYGRSFFGIAGL